MLAALASSLLFAQAADPSVPIESTPQLRTRLKSCELRTAPEHVLPTI